MAESIDALLERYLKLLDQYMSLRETLNAAQSSMYQNLARANFSAERGFRYGQDFYDQRMQAVRRLSSRVSGTGVVKLNTSLDTLHSDQLHVEESSGGEESRSGDEKDTEENGIRNTDKDQDQRPKGPTDPLKWFGLLTPASLRSVQVQSVEAVENIIPQMASIQMEMEEVEIQVRRARKKRAKAEVADKKPGPVVA